MLYILSLKVEVLKCRQGYTLPSLMQPSPSIFLEFLFSEELYSIFQQPLENSFHYPKQDCRESHGALCTPGETILAPGCDYTHSRIKVGTEPCQQGTIPPSPQTLPTHLMNAEFHKEA